MLSLLTVAPVSNSSERSPCFGPFHTIQCILYAILSCKLCESILQYFFPFFFFFVPVFNPLKSTGALHFYMGFLLKCFCTSEAKQCVLVRPSALRLTIIAHVLMRCDLYWVKYMYIFQVQVLLFSTPSSTTAVRVRPKESCRYPACALLAQQLHIQPQRVSPMAVSL